MAKEGAAFNKHQTDISMQREFNFELDYNSIVLIGFKLNSNWI